MEKPNPTEEVSEEDAMEAAMEKPEAAVEKPTPTEEEVIKEGDMEAAVEKPTPTEEEVSKKGVMEATMEKPEAAMEKPTPTEEEVIKEGDMEAAMKKPPPTEEEEVSEEGEVSKEGAMETTAANNRPCKRLKFLVAIMVVIVCVAVILIGVLLADGGDAESRSSSSSKSNLANQTSSVESAPRSAPPSLRASAAPSNVPSDVPSDLPSSAPSTPPTQSKQPTVFPSAVPSQLPSEFPSEAPSTTPSDGPTVYVEPIFVEPNPVPSNPKRSYFNYDPNDSKYGPDNWDRIDTSDNYLTEFGLDGWGPFDGHFDRDTQDNRCGRTGKMSPQDLRQTRGNEEAVCDAGHQIRTLRGKHRLTDEEIIKRIEPNKLRLVLNRRSCLGVRDNEYECEDNPPMADYPRYSSSSSHYSDLLNLDIKAPGEHYIEGESFDAEIQMLHTHVGGRRVNSIGVPIRATAGGFNAEFQAVLDQFQLVYDYDQATCNAATLNRRRAASRFYKDLMKMESEGAEDYQEWEEEYSTPLDDPDLIRRLQEPAPRFNPYTEAFLTTIYFFRYDGSTTEPPCYPLTWWVMLYPMIISFEQLNQIKYLIFTHVDGACEKTSVHNADQSVARPLQSLANDRFIMKCDEGFFVSDEEKGRKPPREYWDDDN